MLKSCFGTVVTACLLVVFGSARVGAAEPVDDLIAKVLAAAGGSEQRPTLLRVKERLVVNADPNAKSIERVSVLEPPTAWWVGKRERVREEKEPAIFLVWGWSLGILQSKESKFERLESVRDGDQSGVGIRVTGSVNPAMDLYFSETSHELLWIDWRSDRHRFSDFREVDGFRYAAKVIGYKRSTGKPWYYSDLLEIERLTALPEGLSR